MKVVPAKADTSRNTRLLERAWFAGLRVRNYLGFRVLGQVIVHRMEDAAQT